MVGPIVVKRDGKASIGYWVWYVTLIFDLTHDFTLDVSMSNFETVVFFVCLIYVNGKEANK